MPKQSYPSASDVQALYQGAGLLSDATVAPYSSIPWSTHVAAAAASFETRTGRQWLATAQTRRFDLPTGPRGLVPLGAELASVSSVTLAGKSLAEGKDYFLGPANADLDGKAFGWIELASLYPLALTTATRRCLVIEGLWGAGSAVPDDVFEAVVNYAAVLAAPEMSVTISGGYYERRIGDSVKRFGGSDDSGPLAQQVSLWTGVFERVVASRPRIAAWFS